MYYNLSTDESKRIKGLKNKFLTYFFRLSMLLVFITAFSVYKNKKELYGGDVTNIQIKYLNKKHTDIGENGRMIYYIDVMDIKHNKRFLLNVDYDRYHTVVNDAKYTITSKFTKYRYGNMIGIDIEGAKYETHMDFCIAIMIISMCIFIFISSSGKYWLGD